MLGLLRISGHSIENDIERIWFLNSYGIMPLPNKVKDSELIGKVDQRIITENKVDEYKRYSECEKFFHAYEKRFDGFNQNLFFLQREFKDKPIYRDDLMGDGMILKFKKDVSPKFGGCFLLEEILYLNLRLTHFGRDWYFNDDEDAKNDFEGLAKTEGIKKNMENRRILIHAGNRIKDTTGCFLPTRTITPIINKYFPGFDPEQCQKDLFTKDYNSLLVTNTKKVVDDLYNRYDELMLIMEPMICLRIS